VAILYSFTALLMVAMFLGWYGILLGLLEWSYRGGLFRELLPMSYLAATLLGVVHFFP
jgi:hypothetical protein